MLFTRADLDAIAAGRVRLAFRRWRQPHVRVGSRLHTAVGVLVVEAVDVVRLDDVSERDARDAGYASRAALRAALQARAGSVFRVALRLVGPDPRVALRQRQAVGDERSALERRLARLDAASRRGPWTLALLRLIAEAPGVRAAELAARVGRETLAFKVDVRKLKNLGLTESLEVGYRVSPRGRALLRQPRRSRARRSRG